MPRSSRRNSVVERRAGLLALAAALPAIARGAAPTGAPALDLILVVGCLAALGWAGASASWWSLVAFAGIAVAVSRQPAAFALALAALAAAVAIGTQRRDLADLRVVSTALAAHSLLWAAPASTAWPVPALAITSAVLLAAHAVSRRPSAVRHRAGRVSLGVAGLSLLAVVLLGAAVAGARDSLRSGLREARAGVDAANRGDYEAAAAALDAAAGHLGRAERAVSAPWTQPARLLPVAAQHHRALGLLSAAGADSLATASQAVDRVDMSRLAVRGGRIDLEAVTATAEPLADVAASLDLVQRALDDAASPWLVGRASRAIAELGDDVAASAVLLERARTAVDLAPSMLGADSTRRYLVLFTTPVEARPGGGFPGNYAVVSAVRGRLGISEFGRISDLESQLPASTPCLSCSAEFLARYGRFGFDSGPGGTLGTAPWRNLTMAADFPTIAPVARELFAAGGNGTVDGVAIVDPYVLQQLLRYTGPVAVDGLDGPVDARNVLPYVLFEQYLETDNAERIDAIDTIGRTVIDAVLSADLPSPPQLARDLGPLVERRRLMLWTADPAEGDLMHRIGLDGSLPDLEPGTAFGFGLTLANAGGNKIDAFLEVGTTTELVEGPDGRPQLAVTVTLHNRAPAVGLPPYLIDNQVGLPRGTNSAFVTFYGAAAPSTATLDGSPLALEPLPDSGWVAASTYLELAPGGSATVTLVYDPADGAISLPSGIDDVVVFAQPLVDSALDLGARAPAR